MKEDLLIYSDESGLNERYRSLCAVSGKENDLDALRQCLFKILQSKNITELKFNEISGHVPKIECCKDFLCVAIDFASRNKIRIDVLIWDIEDSRHKLRGRDDKENLERMYFHLLKHVVESWGIFDFKFFPDEHSEFDYRKIANYLNLTKYPRQKPGDIPLLFRGERINFKVKEVKPQNSQREPLIQIADIFAGFGRFSIQKSAEYTKWRSNSRKNENQDWLFSSDDMLEDPKENKTLNQRFELIDFLSKKCKEKNISVSIKSNDYLKTYDSALQINFWHYEPQGEYDKAPTRKKGTNEDKR
ncbi:hypothetical protein BREVNS_1233 [Brevinematales bacterium NS]|nr:hypothetical protein BREVNS_1233 [Brevinematales bacterium NS]